MKKKYVSPEIFAESFELAEHITGDCSVSGRANHADLGSCGFDAGDPQGKWFLEGVTRCGYDPYDGDVTSMEELRGIDQQCKYDGFMESFIMYAS